MDKVAHTPRWSDYGFLTVNTTTKELAEQIKAKGTDVETFMTSGIPYKDMTQEALMDAYAQKTMERDDRTAQAIKFEAEKREAINASPENAIPFEQIAAEIKMRQDAKDQLAVLESVRKAMQPLKEDFETSFRKGKEAPESSEGRSMTQSQLLKRLSLETGVIMSVGDRPKQISQQFKLMEHRLTRKIEKRQKLIAAIDKTLGPKPSDDGTPETRAIAADPRWPEIGVEE